MSANAAQMAAQPACGRAANRRCRTRMHLQGGFTLVELVVVLVLVGIIFGLVIPAFNTAKEKHRRTVCAYNLQQIGRALFAYAADHTDHLPTRVANREGKTWDRLLVEDNYCPATVLYCPSDRYPRKEGLPRTYGISCGQKGYSGYPPNPAFWLDGIKLPCPYVPKPAEVVLVAERPASGITGYVVGDHFGWVDATYLCSAHYHGACLREPTQYVKRSNYLFLDGHVAWVDHVTPAMFPPKPEKLLVPCP